MLWQTDTCFVRSVILLIPLNLRNTIVKRAEASKEKITDVYRLKAIPGISANSAV